MLPAVPILCPAPPLPHSEIETSFPSYGNCTSIVRMRSNLTKVLDKTEVDTRKCPKGLTHITPLAIMKLADRLWIFSYPSCYFHINITKIARHIFSWGIDIDSYGDTLPVGISFGSGRVCPFFNPQKDSSETFWGMPCILVATRPNSILRIAAIWCFSVMRIPLFHDILARALATTMQSSLFFP